MYWVYMLRTSRNTLYVGQTSHLEMRMKEHREGKRGSKYLRQFETWELVYTEPVSSRSEALKREYALKQLSKKEKENLIQLSPFTHFLKH